LLLVLFALVGYFWKQRINWEQRIKTFQPVALLPMIPRTEMRLSTAGVLLQTEKSQYTFYDWRGKQHWQVSLPDYSRDGKAVDGSAIVLSPDGHYTAMVLLTSKSLWVHQWHDRQPLEDATVQLDPYLLPAEYYTVFGKGIPNNESRLGSYGMYPGLAIDNTGRVTVAMRQASCLKVMTFQGSALQAQGNYQPSVISFLHLKYRELRVRITGTIVTIYEGDGTPSMFHFTEKNHQISISPIQVPHENNAFSITCSGAILLQEYNYRASQYQHKLMRPNGSLTHSGGYEQLSPGGSYVTHRCNFWQEPIRIESVDGRDGWEVPCSTNSEVLALTDDGCHVLQDTTMDTTQNTRDIMQHCPPLYPVSPAKQSYFESTRYRLYERPGKLCGILPYTIRIGISQKEMALQAADHRYAFYFQRKMYALYLWKYTCELSPDGQSLILHASPEDHPSDDVVVLFTLK